MDEQMTICTSSSIRTLTVGSGLSPDLLTSRVLRTASNTFTRALAGSQTGVDLTLKRAPHRLHTAGGEFHPALKTY